MGLSQKLDNAVRRIIVWFVIPLVLSLGLALYSAYRWVRNRV